MPRWEALSEVVPHSHDPDEKPRPRLLNVLAKSNHNDLGVRRLLNGILIRMVTKMKHDTTKPFEPSTVDRKLRTLFALLHQEGAPWKLGDFKGWEGSLDGVTKAFWQETADGDAKFGTKPHRIKFTEEDCTILRRYIESLMFDWIAYILHVLQLLIGIQFGFRGREEHHSLLWSNITFGFYPEHH